MLAMQYSFTLPTDYDMAIIERRIAAKGAMLDGFPGLAFKAYLWAETGFSRENLYAPVYLWRDTSGLTRFLEGEGFKALVAAFGRPVIRTWVPRATAQSPDIASAAWATRRIGVIGGGATLADIPAGVPQPGALASLDAYEPGTWSTLNVDLWRDRPEVDADTQLYRVGHVSTGAKA